eukprot:c5761_g1_i1.p2 GENE.c5761_g1_i1~~c5761_g1_i1.p2  ORF type:complete len:147 (+),score=29.88 c5761_g1_i1:44-442(+)
MADITVIAVAIEHAVAPLGDPMELTIEFASSVTLEGYWATQYMVDHAASRKIIELGRTPVCTYPAAEPSRVVITTEAMDLSAIKSSVLRNMGLLTATLFTAADVEVLQVSFVVQVARAADKSLVRTIFNPLE